MLEWKPNNACKQNRVFVQRRLLRVEQTVHFDIAAQHRG
jgi:hypothetical protein